MDISKESCHSDILVCSKNDEGLKLYRSGFKVAALSHLGK